MTVLDIGASIGAYALPAALRVTPTGRVFALEAGPMNCQLLARSAKASNLANVHLLPFGASDTLGAAYMRRQGFTNNNEIASAESVNIDRLDFYDIVPVLPVDFLRPALGAVDIVKMDIEGMEYKATLGFSALIRECHPIVFCEYSPRFQKHGSGVEGAELLGLFLDMGYRIEILHRNRPRESVTPTNRHDAIEYVDRVWETHVRDDSGSHLDLCFHPVPGNRISNTERPQPSMLTRWFGRDRTSQ
jgi:FkbM family methyltransferase